MKTIIKYSIVLFALISFASCEKAMLGEETSNDPVNNFEIFWNDFDQHYGLFEARGWDWNSVYQEYQPQVTSETTDAELWDIFSQMIKTLDDSHTVLFDFDNDRYIASGQDENETVDEEFSRDLVETKYLDYLTRIEGIAPNETTDDDIFSYGEFTDKNIGYIHLRGFYGFDANKIEEIMATLKDKAAIIFDVRGNNGGDADLGYRIAGEFADGEHFVYTSETRNGPNHDDFGEKFEYYAKPQGSEQYLKPVIILTDNNSVSAAEEFLFFMKAFDAVTQIGTESSGDLSDVSMRRFLPNGWEYQYSTQMYLTPDGKSIDGIGHIPDVYIKNTVADIEAGNDKVLERAFQYLKMEHGVE